MSSYKYKKIAFTLAEVLLTLVLVGLILALTLPSLLIQIRKEQYIAGFQKASNIISQVNNKIISDDDIDFSSSSFTPKTNELMLKFANRLNYKKYCLTYGCKCFHRKGSYYRLNGRPVTESYTVDGNPCVELLDGTLMGFVGAVADLNFKKNSQRIDVGRVEVDINGYSPPNTYGRDIFVFFVTYKGVYVVGSQGSYYYSTSMTNYDVFCNPESTSGRYDSYSCASKIINDGYKMDY